MLFAFAVACVAATSLFITWQQGVPADFFRSTVNENRELSASAATQITPFVSLPQPIGGVANNVITLFALMAPLPLLALGGAYYLLLGLMVFTIWLLFWRGVGKLSRIAEEHHIVVLLRRSIALILAMVTTQAIFEPDYGSALKHLTPLWPLFIAVIWGATSPAAVRGRRAMPADSGEPADDAATNGTIDKMPTAHRQGIQGI